MFAYVRQLTKTKRQKKTFARSKVCNKCTNTCAVVKCGGVASKSGLKEVRERINVTEVKGGS